MSNRLTIKTLKNAYGIKNININNTVEKHANTLKNNIIYASNGVFKTSFSNFFQALKLGKEPLDRITNKKVTYSIFVGENNINDIDLFQNLIVFNNDIFNPQTINELNPKIARLAIANDMVEEINTIYKNLDDIKERLSNIFNYIGLNDTYFNIFTNLNEYNRLDYLEEIVSEILKEGPLEFKLEIPLEIFLSEEYAKVDNEQTRETINEIKKYITNKNKESPFDNKFNVFNYDSLLTGIRTTDFLNDNEKRKIYFDGVTYKNYDEFVNALETSAKELLGDVNKKKLDNILKQIGNRKNPEKKFRSEIFENIEIINTLQYSRKQIIASMLKENSLNELNNLKIEITNLKEIIDNLAENVQKKSSKFTNAIKIFVDRFQPIFKIEIQNELNAALGIQLPIIYINHKSDDSKYISEEKLREVISSGERTTYNILKFIVHYETIKHNNPIIILDDVVDSFDYGNRYAFIEYVRDMVEDGSNLIVLTNNFNFYKTLKSRVPKLDTLYASKNQKNTVEIQKNDKLLSINKNMVFMISDESDLLSAIPFAREISSYTNKDSQGQFLKYFHIKSGTKNLTLGGLANKIKKSVKSAKINNIDLNKRYINTLFDECNRLSQLKNDKMTLKHKLVLAMGIRLKAELILIDGETIKRTNDISNNQTATLFNNFKKYLRADFVRKLNSVLVVTPEFIHLNAFMYEPLIDVPTVILKKLYNDIIKFEKDKSSVWQKSYFNEFKKLKS